MKQIHIFYSGAVQGVGFRYTAQEVAQRLGLTGWVRNRRDGRVELVVTGDEALLQRFLEAVQHGPLRHHIADAAVAWSDALERFHDFEIRPTV